MYKIKILLIFDKMHNDDDDDDNNKTLERKKKHTVKPKKRNQISQNLRVDGRFIYT